MEIGQSNKPSTIPNTIILNVNATLDALREVQYMMQCMLNGEDYSLMVVKGDYNGEFKAVDIEDFSQKFTFSCDNLEGAIDAEHVVLIALKNMLKLEGAEMILECYCVSTPIIPDDDETDDIQTVYRMWYWMDAEMDSRTKTMMNGRITLNVAGLRFREDCFEILKSLEIGENLTLRPDPNNKFDHNALGFYRNNDTLVGYLPKKDQPFAHLFFANDEIKCTISEINGDYVDTEFMPTQEMIVPSVIEDVNMHLEKVQVSKDYRGTTRKHQDLTLEEFTKAFK